MSPILIAFALTLGTYTPVPAITTVDTIQVTAWSGVDDVLEAVALKAGIVKQGDHMRL